ncbi:MAG TPA: hypothetical protein VFC56_09790 [Stellaceae bacterium]|nr:hypothetical protein [Stellaceae bacterium]
MTSSSPSAKKQKNAQRQRFIDAAREAGASEDEAVFVENLKRVAGPKDRHVYTFERSSDADSAPISVGPCENDAMALALLAKQVGGAFSLEGEGEPEYVMRKTSNNNWGRASIPIYNK